MPTHKDQRERWQLTREKILMFFGLAMFVYEAVIVEAIGQRFHFEILIAGMALCGVSIAQWGDKK
jgi:hypothetical protein